jgi:ElaB/YqjD/DUF883 family membrane-anchored ribosome-binding protein
MSVESTVTLTKRSAGRLKDAADGIANDVKSEARSRLGKASDTAHDAYDRAREVTGEARSFLREHSLLAIGVGMAIGMAMTLAMRTNAKAAAQPEHPKTRH